MGGEGGARRRNAFSVGQTLDARRQTRATTTTTTTARARERAGESFRIVSYRIVRFESSRECVSVSCVSRGASLVYSVEC